MTRGEDGKYVLQKEFEAGTHTFHIVKDYRWDTPSGTAATVVLANGTPASVSVSLDSIKFTLSSAGKVTVVFDPAAMTVTASWEDAPTETYVNGFAANGSFQPAEKDADGTHLIANAGQLYWFAEQVNGGNTAINGKLIANIVVNENVLKADGTLNDNGRNFRSWTHIGSQYNYYIGTFDGDGHTISGLYFDATGSAGSDTGLFGRLRDGAVVQNVGLVDSWLRGQYTGGIARANAGGIIANCYNSSSISGIRYIGGIVGENSGTVINCYNTGRIISESRPFSDVGGIVGLQNGITENCYNSGSVTGAKRVGGIAGRNQSTITNCYNIGSVNGSQDVGGIVGYGEMTGAIANCHNVGSIIGSMNVGAILGVDKGETTITNYYYLDSCGAAGEGTSKSADQFAVGEVAYLLGDAFGQKIGIESYPVLGGEKVGQITSGTYSFQPADEWIANGYAATQQGNMWVVAEKPTTADVRIAAVEAADGREVVGAILQILDSKGTVEAEWTSVLDIHVAADLAIGEIYTLKAVAAPEAYVLPAKVTFTIDESGNVTCTGTTTVDSDGNTVMLMEFSKTKVSVLAADVADGDKLEGAILQIIDPNGNVMNQWTSADTACFTEGLHTGKEYILRATVAPDGYSIPADIAFTIDESGQITSTGTVDENGTLLVEFEAAKFDVRFVDWDGSTLKLETVPYGKAATAPADPTREGYTFTGWDKAFDNITGKLTVKAQYTVNTRDIIYMVNGEEYNRTSDVAFGTAIQLIAAPTREGYTFSGWSEAPATMPDKDVTITGTFTQVEYEVEIEQPAGGNVTIDNETPNMGDDVTITVTPDEGEEVVEVIVKDENGDKIDVTQNPDGSYTYEQPAGDVTIEVTMKDSEYEVEIEQPNGGKVETDNENPKLGDDVTITVTPDEGKEVVDVIVKDENGDKIDVTQNPDGSYTYEQPAGDVTVEVGLKLKEHDIIYMVDGVEYDRVEKVAYGTEITLIAEPDKTGYTFSGWNAEIPATMPDKEVVIRGTFTINQYTIAFDTDGGTVIVPITQDYNTEVTPPADPTKTGYDFGGWYTDAELTTACVFGTMPAANITVYAKWNPATGTAYTVKHYHQNTSGSGYTLYESETLRGMTNDETAAEAKNYPGFTAQTFARTTILPDGTTVVEIKYDRNIYTVTLVTNKGTIRDVDVTEYTYGVGSKLPANVTRSGYYFGGWYDNEDCKGTPVSEITTNDIGNKTFYAKWNFIYIPIVTPTYPPVVDGGDNGDVTVTPKNPEMGDTVVITPAPDAGYEVDEITVTDKNGNPITVIDNGDGTYSFKQPSGKVNIEVTFKEIVKVCPGDKTCPMYGFTDLDSSAWYHDGVHFCIANDLMTGTASDTFAPGMTTSRAMIVTILWRLEGKPVVNYAMSFKDVAADTWYTEAVRWAQANKIVSGYSDEAFGPNDVITREQLATILYRYEQYKGGGFTGAWMIRMDYVDLADVSDWAYEAMCWMNMNGIVNGKPGKVLDPKGSATRAEAATMLYRYCEISSKEDN